MIRPEPPDRVAGAPAACAECGYRLADGQRYCLACGARRGPVPPAIAALIDEAVTRARRTEITGGDRNREAGRPRSLEFVAGLPPRAAAVAVMAMLAFGVIVGSGNNSLADTAGGLLVAVSPRPPAPSTRPQAVLRRSAPPLSASSGATSTEAVAAAPAQTQTAQTVTLPSSTTTPSTPASSPAASGPTLPPIKHVFVIMLSDQGYAQAFRPGAKGRYLARTLRRRGELLANYYAVAPGQLANAIALISGQGPTQQTVAGCPTFTEIAPGNTVTGQVLGSGCVYPAKAQTLPDQLTAAGYKWKAYVEGIGNGPAGSAPTCRRPRLGAADGDQVPRPGDPYVTWRNPFVYFQSLTAGNTCASHDVGLRRLVPDLRSSTKAPSFAYIAPSPCNDGDPQPCAPGKSADLKAADSFLRSVVPEIERSAAYKNGGLIAITFDQAPQSGPHADPSACCNNPTYPNLPRGAGTGTTPTTGTTTTQTTPTTGTTTTTPTTGTTATTPGATSPDTTPTTNDITSTTTAVAPTTTTSPTPPTTATTTTTSTSSITTTTTSTTPTAPTGGQTTPTGGGGRVGLLLISKYVKPGSSDSLDYFNHFSLLSSIEALFSLKRLGYAKDPALPAFDRVQYNAYRG